MRSLPWQRVPRQCLLFVLAMLPLHYRYTDMFVAGANNSLTVFAADGRAVCAGASRSVPCFVLDWRRSSWQVIPACMVALFTNSSCTLWLVRPRTHGLNPNPVPHSWTTAAGQRNYRCRGMCKFLFSIWYVCTLQESACQPASCTKLILAPRRIVVIVLTACFPNRSKQGWGL